MTLNAEIWRLGCSETSVMSDLIQNIGKTGQVVLKLKNDTIVKGLSNLKPFRIKIILKRILLKDETKNI